METKSRSPNHQDISELINKTETLIQTIRWQSKQRKWQKTIDIPKETEFCPLLYIKCNRKNGNDTNCFTPKSRGCYAFKRYLRERI